jgi:hypothetical protein
VHRPRKLYTRGQAQTSLAVRLRSLMSYEYKTCATISPTMFPHQRPMRAQFPWVSGSFPQGLTTLVGSGSALGLI